MGANLPTTSPSETKHLRLKELSLPNITKIKNALLPTSSTHSPPPLDKRTLCNTFHIGDRESNLIFEHFDMDMDNQIDYYEFTCAIAMLVHSSFEVRSDFLFKLYDFDLDGYLSREELVHLIRNVLICKHNGPVASTEIENKVDIIIREADYDMDRKLSLTEFQTYLNKNRELFILFDQYSKLLNRGNDTMIKKRKGNTNDNDDIEYDERENIDDDDDGEGEYNDNEFYEEGNVIGDEMDPDLYEELQKDTLAQDKTESDQNINKGVEFANGFMVEEIQGDEFGAVKPWITNVVNTVPSSYKPSKLDGTLPDAQLELEFVHGYRCHDTRNNLRYASSGEIVYHTAALGIVYNKDTHTQRFYNEHFDDITALAIHPERNIVATGEIGPYPLISVWDIENNIALAHIREPLTKGINHLAFSKDGKYLVATAADDVHHVAVFDWEKGVAEDLAGITNHRLKSSKSKTTSKGLVVGSCEGGRANILGVCFNKDATNVALACVKEVNIITISKGKLTKKKATGLRGDNITSIMCCGYLGNNLLCGTMKGKLLVCAGTQFTKTIKAHSSSMNALYIKDNDIGFITGGSDGMVITWDKKYAKLNMFNINTEEVRSLCPRVRSIDEDANGNILIGTRGGEILEIVGDTPKVYLRGHWDKELWGLCVHPERNTFYTVGEDKLLGLWDVDSMKLKQWCKLEEEATSIDVSPNGKELAIGCESGNFYIYDAKTFKKKLKKKESVTKAIEEIKYSPCGSYLAVGGIDKDKDGFMHIFIFDVSRNYTRIKKMKGHQSRITHIDWSNDSDYIQSNSQAYELLYHSINTGAHITKISSMRDVEWATWTCVLGWPVQGVWPECASGDDINACDVDKTKQYLVTSDDYGKVKLFRYPSPIERAAFLQYNGHSSHVTCVRFMNDNRHVISVGGLDKAVFQFKFITNDDAADEAEELMDINENEVNVDNDECELYFKEEEVIEGTEFGASKPWIGELQASSPKIKIDKNAGKQPNQNLKRLKYVFGYRAFDTRMNIKYTADDNKIVYHTAALGIVLDKTTNTQTYFTHHEEDIVSLAIHPNGTTVATGQMAAKGKAKLIDLYVWNINNLPDETNVLANERTNTPKGVTNLKGALLRAIRIVQFSPDGKLLLANGQDDYNSVAVYNTSNLNNITLIGTVKVDGARVLDACWKNNNEFVTVGPKHIKFFKVSGRNITQSKGVYGKVKKEPLVSAIFAFNKLYTGTDKGNIITWDGSNASSLKAVCKNGPLYTLYYYAKDKLLFAGGYDGIIIAYDNAKLNERYRLDIQKITNSPCDCGIRSIDCNAKQEMLIGTKGGDIIEISLQSKTLLRTLMNSHFNNELWALTVNPTNCYEVATGGGDKTLRIWDIKRNRMKKIMIFPEDFRAIDWSSDGTFIIVGTMPGLIYYVDVKQWTKSSPFKSIFYSTAKTKAQQNSDKDKWIQELKISPNNEYVAFGSHCGIGNSFSKIQVLSINSNSNTNVLKQYVTVDPKITSALTHLDWSSDNDRIVCNSLAFELKYVSIAAKSVVKASSCVYEDDMWNTWTCLFGFPVQGIWPPDSTGYVVNYTCRSNNRKVIATGDDFSLVKLFKCPCVVEHANYKAYGGHSSHVPKVRFSNDDRFLISVGGNDKSVLVWETDFGVQREDEDEEEDNEQEERNDNENEDYNEDNDNVNEDEGYNDEEEEEEEAQKVVKKGKGSTKQNVKNNNNNKKKVISTNAKKQVNTSSKRKRQVIIEEEEENENDNDNDDGFDDNYNNENEDDIENNEDENEEEDDNVYIPKPKQKQKQTKQRKPAKTQSQPKKKRYSSHNNNDEDIEEEIQNENEDEDNYIEESKPPKKPSKSKKPIFSIEEEDISATNSANPFSSSLPIDQNINQSQSNSQPQWRKTLYDPDTLPSIPSSPPSLSLTLSHVFGYRTKDNRNNVKYLSKSSIIYHSSNLCVIQDLQTKSQRFFKAHTNEITAFTLSDNRKYVATAEGASSSSNTNIIVWNVNNFNELSHTTIPNGNGIKVLTFTPNNEYVICVELGKTPTLYVISVKDGNIRGKETIDKKVFGIACLTNNDFATVGIKHLKFWKMNATGNTLTHVNGEIQNDLDTKIGVIISDSSSSRYYAGTAEGYIYIFNNDNKLELHKQRHTAVVDALYVNNDKVISGGRDKCVVIMDKELTELRKLDLTNSNLYCRIPAPRSIDICKDNTHTILVGTLSSDVIELQFDDDNIAMSDYTMKSYLNGHYSSVLSENNQIKGIAYLKNNNQFITIGEDCTMRLWNVDHTNVMEHMVEFKTEDDSFILPTALAVNMKYDSIYVGFRTGVINVYGTEKYEMKHQIEVTAIEGNKPITAIEISPDNKYIACGCIEDNEMSCFKLLHNHSTFTVIHAETEHKGEINAIDWSDDSQYVAYSTHMEEMYVFDVNSKHNIYNYSDIRNVTWMTWKRMYGWALKSYYDDDSNSNAKIISCTRSTKEFRGRRVIGIGDEHGVVKVYNYPIIKKGQRCIEGDIKHVRSVTRMCFNDECTVMMTSGEDGVLYKWNVNEE